jgi:hypothetical protein
MKLDIKKGTTSKIIDIFINNSSVTDGSGLTNLAFNTGSLTAYYSLNGAAATAIVIPLITMTIGTWVAGGFVERDAINMPGVYQVGLPDAALTGADSVLVYIKGAADMAPNLSEIQLVDYNPYDGVRMGQTALPNAAANAAGGLIISGAGALDADAQAASVVAIETDTNELQTDDVPTLISNLDAVVDTVKAETVLIKAKTDNLPSDPADQSLIIAATDAIAAAIAALNDPTVADILTAQMSESYAADGVAPTLTQALFLIQQILTEYSASGTIATAKKLDGTTTAATFTFNDASDPSSITRTT